MENLFKKYLDNQCSPEELKKLLSFFTQPENEAMFRKLINDILNCSDDNGKIGQEKIPPGNIFHEIKNQLENEKISLITFLSKTNLQTAAIAFILFENSVLSAG